VRLVLPTAVFVATAIVTAIVTPSAPASAAPGFDVDGYSVCTATTVPAPDQDFDVVVTNCCMQHAGVPTSTKFGMGCVATADATSPDERPTIVLPTRPVPPDDPDVQLPDPTP
jgi:hypothetical protein